MLPSRSLRFSLVFSALIASIGVDRLAAQSPPRFPSLGNDDAWKHLPRENPPLPVWARTLAASLPKTTAAMLELDYVHRAKNPLGAVLYGKIRWAAAEAIGCAYSKNRAEADLRRAGATDADLKAMAGDRKMLPESERQALDFAGKLSRAAYQVTDEEFAGLLKHFGPDKVVAIVHAIAHANFQDRIFLALGIETEDGGHLAPLDYRADPKQKDQMVTPARPAWKESQGVKATVPDGKPNWLDQGFADVQVALGKQSNRQPRIAMPPAEALAKLPPEARERTMRIVWSRVSVGYQPVLTRAWFDCMGTFQREANLDQVFANTFFWVITRSNQCFY